VKGKTLDEASAITREQLVDAVGGLPPTKIQCSVIAAAAIRNAVAKWRRENGSAGAAGGGA
jgi:NifU-like protein involved in Fe-S cluster formation